MKDVTAFLNEYRGNNMDTTQAEAVSLVQRHKDSIDYFIKFGSPIEKAMAQVVLEVAGEQT